MGGVGGKNRGGDSEDSGEILPWEEWVVKIGAEIVRRDTPLGGVGWSK